MNRWIVINLVSFNESLDRIHHRTFLFQVTLKGAKDCVEAARQRILELVGDLDSQVTIECNIEQVRLS